MALLDGRTGKLSDLKVGKWIKVHWVADANDPKRQRISKIEPGMAPWAAERLVELEKSGDVLEMEVRIVFDDAGSKAELHLRGPRSPGDDKDSPSVRLKAGEAAKLLRYLAHEGFLAAAIDGSKVDESREPLGARVAPFKPPYLRLSVGCFYYKAPLSAEEVERLEGIKSVLPKKAAAKMEELLLAQVGRRQH